MELKLEELDVIESPLSDAYWTGFLGAAAVILGAAAIT